MRLGYACKNSIYGGTNSKVILRKLKQLSLSDKEKELKRCTKNNLNNIKNILNWNVKNDIYMFRISHNCFPFLSHDDFREWWKPLEIFKEDVEEIGDIINRYDIRTSIHPQMFCTITGEDPLILGRSIYELNFCGDFLKEMKLKQIPDIIMHLGGKYGNQKLAEQNFKVNFKMLNAYTKKLARFENDHHIYNTLEVYNMSKELNVPMVLDLAHHKFHSGGLDEDTAINLAMSTWPKDLTPKVHLSSQRKDMKKHAHAEFILGEDIAPYLNQKFDIMLEAKATDLALTNIRQKILKNCLLDEYPMI